MSDNLVIKNDDNESDVCINVLNVRTYWICVKMIFYQ